MLRRLLGTPGVRILAGTARSFSDLLGGRERDSLKPHLLKLFKRVHPDLFQQLPVERVRPGLLFELLPGSHQPLGRATGTVSDLHFSLLA